MEPDLVGHYYHKKGAVIPDLGQLYQYITCSNGMFIHAKREHLEVLAPINWFKNPVRGLVAGKGWIRIPKRVTNGQLEWILRAAVMALPNEALFVMKYIPDDLPWAFNSAGWRVDYPAQKADPISVFAQDPYSPVMKDALIEVHSHNYMDAFFSGQDNREEDGLRIYAVIGNIHRQPVDIRVRVGIYGHHIDIPYNQVFEESERVRDATFSR
jgi:PRTRC genetic system protein A